MFRVIAEQGHYAGRTQPTNTRQGIYATAPSGELLASINNNNAERVAGMLREALAKWEQMSDEDRYLDADQLTDAPLRLRNERHYPSDGLVLRVSSRDLPRDGQLAQTPTGRRAWMQTAWNLDYAWFKRDELKAFIPAELFVGARTEIPHRLVHRLAALHLVDNVRGQVGAFSDEDVKLAEMTSRITRIDGGLVTIELNGRSRSVSTGRRRGNAGQQGPEYEERGIETDLTGTATFDRASSRFTAFELVATGTRWGGDRYNGRHDDRERAPIGFAFTLAPNDPPVAPASFWRYGW